MIGICDLVHVATGLQFRLTLYLPLLLPHEGQNQARQCTEGCMKEIYMLGDWYCASPLPPATGKSI